MFGVDCGDDDFLDVNEVLRNVTLDAYAKYIKRRLASPEDVRMAVSGAQSARKQPDVS